MSTNGNGTTQTTQQLEKLADIAADIAAVGGAEKIVEDFLTRVQSAAELLAAVGRELGQVGDQDEREFIADAKELHSRAKEIVERRLARKRRELGDLERILGKIGG